MTVYAAYSVLVRINQNSMKDCLVGTTIVVEGDDGNKGNPLTFDLILLSGLFVYKSAVLVLTNFLSNLVSNSI